VSPPDFSPFDFVPISENGISQLSTSGRRAVVQHVHVVQLIGYQIQKKLVFFELRLEPSSQREMSAGAGGEENGGRIKCGTARIFK
jgi:hypothetical protein